MLALEQGALVQDPVVAFQIFLLILLRPHGGREPVLGVHGIGAVFGHDEGLVQVQRLPFGQLLAEGVFGVAQFVAAADVPAVIAVEADEIGELIAMAGMGAGVDHLRPGPGSFLGIQLPRQIEYCLEIGHGGRIGGVRLVEQAPCDDAGAVLIPGDQLPDGVFVVFQKLGNGVLGKPGGGGSADTGIGEVHQAFIEADGRHFVHNEEALPVCHAVDHLVHGIMGGAEGVGADPLHQFKVPLHHGHIEGTTHDVAVLVLAEALEIDGAAVDEDIGVLDLHGADADVIGILIQNGIAVQNADDEQVQIGVAHLPQAGALNGQTAFLAFAFGDQGAVFVIDLYGDLVFAGGNDFVVCQGTSGGQGVDDFKVFDTLFGQAHQMDGAVQTAVVIEVEVGLVDLRAGDQRDGSAGRQGSVGQLVVDLHADPVGGVEPDGVGDIQSKRQETAFVAACEGAVDVYAGAVGRGAESQHNGLTFPFTGDKDFSLIPEVAAEFPGLLVREEIVETGGHGHGNGGRQSLTVPLAVQPFFFAVELELPETVQRNDPAGNGLNGIKHGVHGSSPV